MYVKKQRNYTNELIIILYVIYVTAKVKFLEKFSLIRLEKI